MDIAPPAAYAQERAVCVDTTAAGGNASLLVAGARGQCMRAERTML